MNLVFVDESGVGGGVVDYLRRMNQKVTGVHFGSAANRSYNTESGAVIYANKRAEMWGNMRDWLQGGSIPDDPDLASQLTGVEYGYSFKGGHDAIQLEKKTDMKKRGLSSPDRGDALALTFAHPVQPSYHTMPYEGGHGDNPYFRSNYNPLSREKVREVTSEAWRRMRGQQPRNPYYKNGYGMD